MSAPSATRAKATRAKRKPAAAESEAAAAAAANDELRKILEDVGEDFPVAADGTITPVKIGKSGRTPNPMQDLFELDGVMYQIPSKPHPARILEFMRDARDRRIGQQAATLSLLTDMIGDDAMSALMASSEVDEADMAKILTIVAQVAFGNARKIKDASGNS